jgi:hypothetical protein
MQIQLTFGDKGIRACRKARFLFVLVCGLLFVGVLLLSARFYFVSELLVMLAFMAILFSIVIIFLVLGVLVQEGVRCGLRWIRVQIAASFLSQCISAADVKGLRRTWIRT